MKNGGNNMSIIFEGKCPKCNVSLIFLKGKCPKCKVITIFYEGKKDYYCAHCKALISKEAIGGDIKIV